MDMEMADYEKLVKELNHKLCERERQIEEYKTQQQTQKQEEQRLNEEIGMCVSYVPSVLYTKYLMDVWV